MILDLIAGMGAAPDASGIVLVGTSVASLASGGTINVSMPAGIQSGDLAFYSVCSNASDSRTITAPSGWTEIAETSAGLNCACGYKVLVGNETSIGAAFSGTYSALSGMVFVYRNATLVVTGTYGLEGSGSTPAGSPIVAQAGKLIFIAAATDTNNGIVLPADMTLVVAVSNTNVTPPPQIVGIRDVVAGNTGVVSATNDVTTATAGILLNIS